MQRHILNERIDINIWNTGMDIFIRVCIEIRICISMSIHIYIYSCGHIYKDI